MTLHWKAVEQYFTVVSCLFFDFAQYIILENLPILDSTLSGMKSLLINMFLLIVYSQLRCQVKMLFIIFPVPLYAFVLVQILREYIMS